jgi:hypothetical protein
VARLVLAGLGNLKRNVLSLFAKAFRESSPKCSRASLLNNFCWFAVAASCSILAMPAPAQQSQTIINIRNAGGISCSEFLASMRQGNNPIEQTAFLQWAAAYTTSFARDRSLIDAFPIIDTAELVVLTGLVCLESENAKFEVALRTALLRMEPFWIRRSPEILNLNDPSGRRVEFFAEATRAFQEALNRFGASIPADGNYGNQTGNAVRRLNEARGSAPWLTPDGELLYQLTRP